MFAGDLDIEAAVSDLANAIPEPLRPLARIAFDYRWSWSVDGAAVFESVDPDRWTRVVGHNPVRLLAEAHRSTLERAAGDQSLLQRISALAAELEADRERPWLDGPATVEHPIALCCGVRCARLAAHLLGGLGVLAGDILKRLPTSGCRWWSVCCATGYFHQRIDVTGFQHEYWIDTDPNSLPCVRVTGPDGLPVTVSVPIDDDDVTAQVWRVDVGRVPL
jgi:starch phosphorylase